MLKTHADIIGLWSSVPDSSQKGVADFSRAMGVSLTLAHSWHRRNNIPSEWWDRIVAAVAVLEVQGQTEHDQICRAAARMVTYDLLRATAKTAWRNMEMKNEIADIAGGVAQLENRLISILPRHYALAKLRGESNLPDLASAVQSFKKLEFELSKVASAFSV